MFDQMPREAYADIVKEIRTAILATDLAMYFKRRATLYQIYSDNKFNIDDPEHRCLFKSIVMTSADLSGQCKPFPVVRKITELVYQEFYNEGDRQKQLGHCPLSIMDREKQNMIPSDQVQFLTIIVLPCTLLLSKILPNCSAMYREAM